MVMCGVVGVKKGVCVPLRSVPAQTHFPDAHTAFVDI